MVSCRLGASLGTSVCVLVVTAFTLGHMHGKTAGLTLNSDNGIPTSTLPTMDNVGYQYSQAQVAPAENLDGSALDERANEVPSGDGATTSANNQELNQISAATSANMDPPVLVVDSKAPVCVFIPKTGTTSAAGFINSCHVRRVSPCQIVNRTNGEVVHHHSTNCNPVDTFRQVGNMRGLTHFGGHNQSPRVELQQTNPGLLTPGVHDILLPGLLHTKSEDYLT